MNSLTARRLCALTNSFYASHADSFSATRQGAWQGWQRCLETVGILPSTTLRALDVACGNLRFFSYLCVRETLGVRFELYAVDNCDELLAQEGITAACLPKVHYYNLDIMNALLDGKNIAEQLEVRNCNLVTCFGFMHHIPQHSLRREFMHDLTDMCTPGAYIALSFWQFMNNAKLAAKARTVHTQALTTCGFAETDLDEGDYLLGWQDLPVEPENIRYAHSFCAAELEDLIESMTPYASCVARFEADGRTSNLNSYLIFKTK